MPQQRRLFGKEETALETAKRTYDDTEIDLMEILQVILSKWIPIVAIGLLAAILAGVGTAFFITKKYTATASMYVYTNPKGTESGTITSADLAAADNLIKTYQAIVKSNAALEVVSARLNQEHPEYVDFNVTPARLKNMTSVNVPTGTKLLEIKVVTVNPQLSADIANTFAQYVPDEIIRITKAGGVEIVDYATAPAQGPVGHHHLFRRGDRQGDQLSRHRKHPPCGGGRRSSGALERVRKGGDHSWKLKKRDPRRRSPP